MKKGKLLFIIVGLCTLIAMMTLCLTGCNQGKYFEQVSSYTFWENEGSESIAQTHVYDMVKEHMENENGKVKKVLVLGFDGTRAETMVNIRPSGVKDENGNDIYSGDNPKAKFSAVNYIVDDLGGKMYLAYAGGSNKDNFQATSTAPGWAAITTGCWGVENGVIDNPDAEKFYARVCRKRIQYNIYGKLECSQNNLQRRNYVCRCCTKANGLLYP